VKVLVEHGVRIDSEDSDLLLEACFWGLPELVTFLVGKSVNPNTMLAAETTILDLVKHQQLKLDQNNDSEAKRVKELDEVIEMLVDGGAKYFTELENARIESKPKRRPSLNARSKRVKLSKGRPRH